MEDFKSPGIHCLHLQGQTVMVKALQFLEAAVTVYRSVRRNIQEDVSNKTGNVRMYNVTLMFVHETTVTAEGI
jgi:hypothetical protein